MNIRRDSACSNAGLRGVPSYDTSESCKQPKIGYICQLTNIVVCPRGAPWQIRAWPALGCWLTSGSRPTLSCCCIAFGCQWTLMNRREDETPPSDCFVFGVIVGPPSRGAIGDHHRSVDRPSAIRSDRCWATRSSIHYGNISKFQDRSSTFGMEDDCCLDAIILTCLPVILRFT